MTRTHHQPAARRHHFFKQALISQNRFFCPSSLLATWHRDAGTRPFLCPSSLLATRHRDAGTRPFHSGGEGEDGGKRKKPSRRLEPQMATSICDSDVPGRVETFSVIRSHRDPPLKPHKQWEEKNRSRDQLPVLISSCLDHRSRKEENLLHETFHENLLFGIRNAASDESPAGSLNPYPPHAGREPAVLPRVTFPELSLVPPRG